MSNYNADIRIGVVGQSKLKTLQKDLDKVNASVKKLNKALVLKTRAQTIKLNTKGANTAIKQLEDRINKLGRTITVNVRTNEQKGSGGAKGGGGGVFVSNNSPAQQLATAKAAQPIARALTNEAQDLLDTEQARNKAIGETVELREKVNSQLKKQADLDKKINTVENSATPQARTANMNRLFGGNVSKKGNKLSPKQSFALANQEATRLEGSINRVGQAYKASLPAVTATSKAYQQVAGNAKRAADGELKAADAATKQAAARKKFNKGFGAGAGVAAASAAGNIPVLGDAVTGGLIASFTGGSVAAGALGGALVGVVSGLAALGSQAAITRAEFDKLNISLSLAAGDEYAASVEAIRRVVDDFNAPLVDTTEQFTKLYAASQGSGIAFSELEDLFVGLSAANKAYAGDAEDLNGILRAFTQIISKGTVQSEELKGQVGERLPGAFKKAADSLGLTTAQLQKALEQGEIQSADFVKKFGKYMLQYEKDAKIIADSPAEAGARLEVALVDLNNRIGPVFASLGAQFQKFATAAVNYLIPVIDYLNQLFDVGSNADRLEQKIGKVLTLNQKIFEVETKRNGLTDTTARNALAEDLASLTNRRDILQGEADELRKLLGAQKRTTGAANTINSTTPDDPLKPKGSGSQGPDRAKLAADMLEDQRRLIELEYAKTDLEENLLQIEYDKMDALKKIKDIEASKQAQAIKNEEELAKVRSGKAIGKALAADAEDLIKKDKERKAALDEILIPLQEQELLLQARLNGNEKEVEIDLIIEDAKRRINDIDAEALRTQLEKINALEKENELVAEQEQFWGSINQTVVSGLQRGIEGLITGAESLNDVLSDVLGQIGSLLINAALSSAAGPGGLFGPKGIPGFRAEGGPINAGMPYIVGEKGPELVVPGASGTVIPNDAFSAATKALQSNGSGTAAGVDGAASQGEAFAVANGARSINTETSRNTSTMNMIREYEERVINNPTPLQVDYQATVINNQTYVTEEQFRKGLTQSSNRARQATFRDLRNNPASRKMAGVKR